METNNREKRNKKAGDGGEEEEEEEEIVFFPSGCVLVELVSLLGESYYMCS